MSDHNVLQSRSVVAAAIVAFGLTAAPGMTLAHHQPEQSGLFLRGDANGDGTLDDDDAIFLLTALFLGGPQPLCQDAADSDDTGVLNVTDAIYLLSALFLNGSPPPPPGPLTPGLDLTADALSCATHGPRYPKPSVGRSWEVPDGIGVADVNHDGHLDILVTDQNWELANPPAPSELLVYLGRGDGSYLPVRKFPLGRGARRLAVADVNHDTHPDVLAANGGGSGGGAVGLSLLLGRGDGTFEAQRQVPVGGAPEDLTVGDVNEDGHLDVLSALPALNQLSIVLGDGAGGFRPPFPVEVAGTPQALVMADLNGDGHLDAASANTAADDLLWLSGDGRGSFRSQARMPVGDNPRGVAAADLNGDGFPELVVANIGDVQRTNGSLSVLVNRRDGTFAPEQRIAMPFRDVRVVAAADVTYDGRLDLLVGGARHALLAGRGDATFDPPTLLPNQDIRVQSALGVADVNQDGLQDLVIQGYEAAALLFGTGPGTFATEDRVPTGSAAQSAVIADFNADGLEDVAVLNIASSDVAVLVGGGDGTLTQRARIPVGAPNPNISGIFYGTAAIASADYNQDGLLDLVTADPGLDGVTLLRGVGNGDFERDGRILLSGEPAGVALAEVSGDGRVDLVTANPRSGDVAVLLGDGIGFSLSARVTVGGNPLAVRVADVNADGAGDVVTGNFGSGSVDVLLGRGDGTFAAAQSFGTLGDAYAVTLADVDADGHLDALAPLFDASAVALLRGNGDGTFQPFVHLPVGNIPLGVAVGDVNLDGHPDVLAANNSSGSVSLLLGRGDGTFDTEQRFEVTGARAVEAVDLNRDGRLDLLTVNAGTGSIAVLLHQ